MFKQYNRVLCYTLSAITDHLIISLFLIAMPLILAIDVSLKPYLIKLIVDSLQKCEPYFTNNETIKYVFVYILFSLFVIFLSWIYHYIIYIQFIPTLRSKICLYFYKKLLNGLYYFHQNSFSGELVSKINDLTSSLHNMILIFFEKFVFYFLSICLAFFFLHKINIIFSVIVIVWCLLVIMFVFLTNRKALNLSRQFSKFGGVITGKLVDGLSNVLAVKLFLGIKKEINILGDTLTKTEESERGLEKHYLFISSVISFSFLIIQIINFFLLIQGRKEGNISISDFVVVIGINFALYDILSNFSKNLSEFSKIVGKVMHAFEKLSVSSENNTLSDESATIKNGDISFEDVCFSYTRNISVFDRLSFSINSGEKIGIVGLSGIGKSTILHLLLKLFVVDKGKIFLNGKDLDKIKVEDIRNAISVIPQDPLLFHRTILENIRYSRPCASDQEVMDAAIKAGAHDFIMNLPYHYNTTIGEKGIKLSGGQRQRISIARGLLKKSCILVLDEATSQLDSIVENFIQNNIFDRMCDKTIIVIAHRLSTLEKMDKILLIDNGKLAGNGSHEELLQKNIVYKKLWESQIKSNK